MRHLYPSKSKIQVYKYPMYKGNIEDVFDDCLDFIEEDLNSKYIIGHTLEHRTGQRIKRYENDGRFEIKNVYLLYSCESKNEAIQMEDSLIRGCLNDKNLQNIRKRESWQPNSLSNDSYIVYVATE